MVPAAPVILKRKRGGKQVDAEDDEDQDEDAVPNAAPKARSRPSRRTRASKREPSAADENSAADDSSSVQYDGGEEADKKLEEVIESDEEMKEAARTLLAIRNSADK